MGTPTPHDVEFTLTPMGTTLGFVLKILISRQTHQEGLQIQTQLLQAYKCGKNPFKCVYYGSFPWNSHPFL